MKKTFVSTLFAMACLPLAQALTLQPREILVEKDGPPVRRYFFQDEGKRLLFRIDGKMSVRGSANQAVFGFSDIHDAAMKLSKSGMTPQIPFDEKNLELYRTAARVYLSGQATDVKITEETPDAIPINGWVSHQIAFSYKIRGVPCRQSITFFNYSSTDQLVFDVMSSEAEYEKTYERSYRVLNSLSEYVPKSETGPT
jgi:hypothetical protein